MDTFKSFIPQLYPVNDQLFSDIALILFKFQARHNELYGKYLQALNVDIDKIHSINQIPFLPISFFKSHQVKTGFWEPKAIFRSSGTTAQTTSCHEVFDLSFYHQHAVQCFGERFGSLNDYHVLALLPSYLERNDSSLVSMMDFFIKQSGSASSGFYLHDIDKLISDYNALKDGSRKIIIWGVTFALLDLAEVGVDLRHAMIFETGGMKGRRTEITRMQLHDVLRKGLHVDRVFSEYGMTELLSQAYTDGSTKFYPPKSMRIIGRDLSDPMEKGLYNQTVGLNVIDLANFHSVAFIETEDIGKVYQDGTFEVLGRIDNSDIRGCNLMLA